MEKVVFSSYMFDGYSVGALGYLLKSPKPEQIEDILKRAQAALCRGMEQTFYSKLDQVAAEVDGGFAPIWSAAAVERVEGSESAAPVLQPRLQEKI